MPLFINTLFFPEIPKPIVLKKYGFMTMGFLKLLLIAELGAHTLMGKEL